MLCFNVSNRLYEASLLPFSQPKVELSVNFLAPMLRVGAPVPYALRTRKRYSLTVLRGATLNQTARLGTVRIPRPRTEDRPLAGVLSIGSPGDPKTKGGAEHRRARRDSVAAPALLVASVSGATHRGAVSAPY